MQIGPGKTLGRLVRPGGGGALGHRLPPWRRCCGPFSSPPVPYPGRKSKIQSDWAAAARCASCPPWRHRLGLVGVGFEVLRVGALVGVGCERHQLRLDSTVLVCPRILVGWCSSTAACAARFRRCGAFDPAVGNCGSLPGCSGMLAALGHLVVFSYAAGGHGSSTTCLFASLSLLFPPRRLLPVAFLLHLAGQGLRRCGRCAVLPMPRWSCTTADLGFETGSPSALGEHLPLSTVGRIPSQGEGVVALFGTVEGGAGFLLPNDAALFMTPILIASCSSLCRSCSVLGARSLRHLLAVLHFLFPCASLCVVL